MHFLCRSFIGPPSSSSWSQYWENEPDDPAASLSKGHLFGLITLSSPHPDLPSLGRQLIIALNQTYFTATLSVKDSLELAAQTLPPSSKVSLLVIIGQTAHLFTRGSTVIILKRGQQVSQFSQPLSGPIQNLDRFLLSTSEFIDFFTWEKIKSTLAENRVQTIEEIFLPQICLPGQKSNLAASLVEVFTDNSEEGNSLPPAEVAPPPKAPFPAKFRFLDLFKPRKSVFVSNFDTPQSLRRRRLNSAVGLLAIILIVTFSLIVYRHNRQSSLNSQYAKLKTSLESNIQNALAVKNLDPASALALVNQAKQILDQMNQLGPNPEVENYRQQIASFSARLGSASDFNPPSFYDTSLLAPSPAFDHL